MNQLQKVLTACTCCSLVFVSAIWEKHPSVDVHYMRARISSVLVAAPSNTNRTEDAVPDADSLRASKYGDGALGHYNDSDPTELRSLAVSLVESGARVHASVGYSPGFSGARIVSHDNATHELVTDKPIVFTITEPDATMYEPGQEIWRMVLEFGDRDQAGFPMKKPGEKHTWWDMDALVEPTEDELRGIQVPPGPGVHEIDFTIRDHFMNKNTGIISYTVEDGAPPNVVNGEKCGTAFASDMVMSQHLAMAKGKHTGLCSARFPLISKSVDPFYGVDFEDACDTEMDTRGLGEDSSSITWKLLDGEVVGDDMNLVDLDATGIMLTAGTYNITLFKEDSGGNRAECSISLKVPMPDDTDNLTAYLPMTDAEYMVYRENGESRKVYEEGNGISLPILDNLPIIGNPVYTFTVCEARMVRFGVGYTSLCGPMWAFGESEACGSIPNKEETGMNAKCGKWKELVDMDAVRAKQNFEKNRSTLVRGFENRALLCNPWVRVVQPMKRCAVNASNGVLAERNMGRNETACLEYCSHAWAQMDSNGSLPDPPFEGGPLWCSHSSASGECVLASNCFKKGILNDDLYTKSFTNFVGAYLDGSTWDEDVRASVIRGRFAVTPFKDETTKLDVKYTLQPECWIERGESGHLDMDTYQFDMLQEPKVSGRFLHCPFKSIEVQLPASGSITVYDALEGDNRRGIPSFEGGCGTHMANVSDLQLNQSVGQGTYHIMFELEDIVGSLSNSRCEVTLKVIPIEPPEVEFTCPDDQTLQLSNRSAFVTASWEEPVMRLTNDTSTIVPQSEYEYGTPVARPGMALTPGIYMLKYTAENYAYGDDMLTCEFILTVEDAVVPVFGNALYECGDDDIGVSENEACGGHRLQVDYDEATGINTMLGVETLEQYDCCGDLTCQKVPMADGKTTSDNAVALQLCMPAA